jgi:anti-sigma factor RsiW
MTRKSQAPARKPRKRVRHGQARHSRANCLKVLRRLSAYLDDELPGDLCREIRKHMGACPNCEVFLASLRETIRLCRHVAPAPLSAAAKARLRSQILRAAGPSTRLRTGPSTRLRTGR